MTATAFIQLRYYDQDPFDSDDGVSLLEPVAVEQSEARFQLAHALDDLGLHLARVRPELPPGRYPVDLRWTREGQKKGLQFPVLTALLPGERQAEQVYPYLALRGAEVLARLSKQRPELLSANGKKLYCVAGPAEETAASTQRGAFLLEDLDEEPDISVLVQDFPEDRPVQVDDLPELGAEWNGARNLTVTCPERVLRDLLREVAQDEGQLFEETGWYLLGRVVRNGPEGDLRLQIEDVTRARETISTAASVVFSEETKVAVTEEIGRRERRGEVPGLRVVGWVHTHDVGAVLEERKRTHSTAEVDDEPAADEGSHEPADGRFFSLYDELFHRKDFPAASVALVIDAPAARRNPEDLERCIAAWGTVSGVIMRRGLRLVTNSE